MNALTGAATSLIANSPEGKTAQYVKYGIIASVLLISFILIMAGSIVAADSTNPCKDAQASAVIITGLWIGSLMGMYLFFRGFSIDNDIQAKFDDDPLLSTVGRLFKRS